jgi:hypothetical protein
MDLVKPLRTFVVLITALFGVSASEPPSTTWCDLTVHEWGTFTSVAAEDGSPIKWDTLGCKDDLPAFVSNSGYRGLKARLMETVRMETPVLYFYSPEAVTAHVKVTFPQGSLTDWYPRAEVSPPTRAGGSSIEWNAIQVQPTSTHLLPVEPGPSRYYAARATDAASLEVGGQHEKFLFYRGVGTFSIPLSARLAANGTVLVENRGHDPVPVVIYFENRDGRFGYRNAGSITQSVTLEPPKTGSTFEALRHDLQNALVAQGLFPKEASAMVETWKDSWFGKGARLIYIVPSQAVDQILPLQIEPHPVETTRVFVGRIEFQPRHCE